MLEIRFRLELAFHGEGREGHSRPEMALYETFGQARAHDVGHLTPAFGYILPPEASQGLQAHGSSLENCAQLGNSSDLSHLLQVQRVMWRLGACDSHLLELHKLRITQDSPNMALTCFK